MFREGSRSKANAKFTSLRLTEDLELSKLEEVAEMLVKVLRRVSKHWIRLDPFNSTQLTVRDRGKAGSFSGICIKASTGTRPAQPMVRTHCCLPLLFPFLINEKINFFSYALIHGNF